MVDGTASRHGRVAARPSSRGEPASRGAFVRAEKSTLGERSDALSLVAPWRLCAVLKMQSSPDQTDDARSATGALGRQLPLDHTRISWEVGRIRHVEGAAGRAPCVVSLCARPADTVWSTPVSLATPAGQTP
jgi:hypothetical protein